MTKPSPGMLRAHRDRLRRQGLRPIQIWVPDVGSPSFKAKAHRQSLAVAQEQGALSWELRTATSLARLLRNQGRPADAIACLRPVYGRFTEGFGTADLIAAKQLLDELRDAGRR